LSIFFNTALLAYFFPHKSGKLSPSSLRAAKNWQLFPFLAARLLRLSGLLLRCRLIADQIAAGQMARTSD